MEQIKENQEMEKLMNEIDAMQTLEKESVQRMHDAIDKAYNYAKIEATLTAIDPKASGEDIANLDAIAAILKPFTTTMQIRDTSDRIDMILKEFAKERKGCE